MERIEYVFLNKIFKNEDDSRYLYQVVTNIACDFNISFKIIDIDGLKKLCEETKIGDINREYDFRIKDGMLMCSNVPTVIVEDNILDSLENSVKTQCTDDIPLIYSLFRDLVESEAKYVDYSFLEEYKENNYSLAFSQFVPIYSKSTMTVYVRLKTNDGWRVRKLIYAENGMLKSNKFLVALKNQNDIVANKYDLKYIGEYEVVNEKFYIYEYELNLSLFTYADNYTTLPIPILNRYVFMSAINADSANALNDIYNVILKSIDDRPSGEEPKEEPVDRGSYSRYNQDYVVMKLSRKPITKDERMEYVADIDSHLQQFMVNGELDQSKVDERTKELCLDFNATAVYNLLVNVFSAKCNSVVDRLDYINNLYYLFKINKFYFDTIIYAIRALSFQNIGIMRNYEEKLLTNGNSPYYGKIKRRVYDAR